MLITREIETLDATRRSQKLHQLYIVIFLKTYYEWLCHVLRNTKYTRHDTDDENTVSLCFLVFSVFGQNNSQINVERWKVGAGHRAIKYSQPANTVLCDCGLRHVVDVQSGIILSTLTLVGNRGHH